MSEPAKHAFGPVQCSDCGVDGLLTWLKDRLSHAPRQGASINFINAHVFNLSWKHEALRAMINRADIVAADGMVIVWSARLFGFRIPSRCNMTDAFRAFLAWDEARPVNAVLIGGSDETAAKAAGAIASTAPWLKIARVVSGYHDVEDYAAKLSGIDAPDLILLGMGTPKTERVIHALRSRFPEAVLWHIGGGTINFLAGEQVEAPSWMRKIGIQWLHRLVCEPRRMWRRYVIGNPLFIGRVVWAALRRPT